MEHQRYTLLLFLLASVIGQFVLAKEAGRGVTWGPAESGLQAGISLASTKQTYRHGEPIRFALSVRNVGDRPITIEYCKRPIGAWAPEVHDKAGKGVPVLPPILPHGGRIIRLILKPGETQVVNQGTFTPRPYGWAGKVGRAVMIADAGVYGVTYTLQFEPTHPGLAREAPWSGELKTGMLDFQVDANKGDPKAKPLKSASRDDVRSVMSLLGTHTRHRLGTGVPINGDSEGWMQRRRDWGARCGVLTRGAVGYLAHVAVGYPDDGYRAVACKALGETKGMPVVPPLIKCLADKSPGVRRTAVRSLGNLRAFEAIPEMQKLLRDADDVIRSAAAYALGHVGSNRATRALVQSFETEEDLRVKGAVLLALGWIADPAALPALRKELAGPTKLSTVGLKNAIRNIEDPDYWGLGVKAGVSARDLYRLLLEMLDFADPPISAAEAKREIFDRQGQWTGAFGGRRGMVYYLPKQNVFYVRQDRADVDESDYFGPFDGNPHELVRPGRKALENRKARR
jgi:hypothetical protein